MLLEVIAYNLEDVKKINQSNASRIELVRDIDKEGLSPSKELILEACEISNIPINVMVRETWDSFVYSDEEFEKLLNEIDFIKTTAVNGIVFGSLTTENKINEKQLAEVIKRKEHLEITFHKAFDLVDDFTNQYNLLQKYNVTNVLTTCGASFEANQDKIKELAKINNPKVLIGGGINETNFKAAMRISQNVHIGKLARKNNDINNEIDVDKINKLFKGK
ncbi:copper homeostasis protein CutC [Spiroplasma endosymbiont of Crioceris asparagi]|uniref:copper homeostasis protein CutC n=1 Tax=Spiroplasma endosymbiont of Crioceris asparagi TaxID=3066286 RepID=UPI0030CDA94E